MIKNSPVAICDGFNVYRSLSVTRNERHYLYINGKRIWLHHYLVNKYIRKIKQGEIVHHKDFNHINDSINNLEILTRSEHIKKHKPVLGYKFTKEQKKRISDAHKGQKAWNKGLSGFKHSDISKENMSKAQKGRIITWGHKISKAKKKVTRQQILEYLKNNQESSLREIRDHFKLKSNSPIRAYGGLRKLRKEAVV